MAENTEQVDVPVGDEVLNADDLKVEKTEEELAAEAEALAAQDEELSVQIGDEEPPPQEQEEAPQWVKDLRKQQRELIKENRELKRNLQTGQPAQQKPALSERPKLADFDYDEDKHQAALDGWYAKKLEIDQFEANQRRAAEDAQKQVEEVRKAYQTKASSLKVPDYQAAEEEVIATLSEAQQGLILGGADNAPLLVYALGKNPKRLSELAAIKDPVKFAFAAAKLEKDLKVSNRKNEKPAPETTVKSSGPVVSGNATLERLRAEAQKTGDMSKVVAYKRQMRK